MIKLLHSYGLPAAMAVLIGLSNYDYKVKGHGNVLPGNSGNQSKTILNTSVAMGAYQSNTERNNSQQEK